MHVCVCTRLHWSEMGLFLNLSTHSPRFFWSRESSPHERIKAVHKKLMIGNHPDSGGSDLIAAKVNEAKDVLLGKKKQETIF